MEEISRQRTYRQLLNVTQFWCSIFNFLNGINVAIHGGQDNDYILIMCGVSLAVSHLFALVKSEFSEKPIVGYPGLWFRILMLVIVSGPSLTVFVIFGLERSIHGVALFTLVIFSIGYSWFILTTVIWISYNNMSCSPTVSNKYTRKRRDSYKVVEATTKNKTKHDEEEGIYENGDVVVSSSI